MTAYNTDWLDVLWTKSVAGEWHKKGLLTDEKWAAIKARHTAHFYSPNLFIRIGLAIFCLILLFAVMGLFVALVGLGSEIGFSMFFLFWGIVWIVVLESWTIRSACHRASGIDDMLLYVGTGAIITGFCNPLHYTPPILVYYCIALPFMIAGSIRYLDHLMAAAAYCCALFIILLVVKDIPKLALYLLPFAGMLFSVGAYFFARQGLQRYNWRHGHGLLVIIELLALATLYASGNYWMIQQAGAEMFQLEQVPMAWFFWAFTFIVPLVYIFLGLQRRDRIMIDVGLACLAAAAFTFCYYIHVLPLASASALGGVALFVIAYVSIHHLRKNVGAYTYEADSDTTLLKEIEGQL